MTNIHESGVIAAPVQLVWDYVRDFNTLPKWFPGVTDSHIEARARAFHTAGIKPLDALHLASAVAAQAEYLCTCDDRFLRRAQAMDTHPTQVLSPLALVAEITR